MCENMFRLMCRSRNHQTIRTTSLPTTVKLLRRMIVRHKETVVISAVKASKESYDICPKQNTVRYAIPFSKFQIESCGDVYNNYLWWCFRQYCLFSVVRTTGNVFKWFSWNLVGLWIGYCCGTKQLNFRVDHTQIGGHVELLATWLLQLSIDSCLGVWLLMCFLQKFLLFL